MVLLACLIQAEHALSEMLDNIRVHDLEDGIAFIGRCFNQLPSDYAFIADEGTISGRFHYLSAMQNQQPWQLVCARANYFVSYTDVDGLE